LAARLYTGQQSQRQSIAQVCGLSLCTTDHFRKTIAVKQKTLEKWEPTVRYGNFASRKDWMASFLDFQISKLEERCVEIRAEMDAKLSEINREPIWN
jgi:hypothetical protein